MAVQLIIQHNSKFVIKLETMKVRIYIFRTSTLWTTWPDYQLAESSGLELDYDDEKSDYRNTNFPARYIYENVLPEVVRDYSDIHYHRGSPYSGHGRPTTDANYGDLHQCESSSQDYCGCLMSFPKGTSGTELKSHGITGIDYLAVLCPSSECKIYEIYFL